MAAEETEFTTEATPVFDAGMGSVEPGASQEGGQAAGRYGRPRPNAVRPNATLMPNVPRQDGATAGLADQEVDDHFSVDRGTADKRSGGDYGQSLPLGFDDGLFSDEEPGFGAPSAFDDVHVSGASIEPALLINTHSGARHKIFALPFLIGSDPHCDLVLNDSKVAPHQAEIVDHFGHLVIRDLNLEGDQYIEVNGAPGDKVILERGDKIRVGGQHFSFQPGRGLTNRPADTFVDTNSAAFANKGRSSFLSRMGRQWMFLAPLAVLGYATYVFIDTYVLEPEPTISHPKVVKRPMPNDQPPVMTPPLEGAMQANNGGIHFTIGEESAPPNVPQPPARPTSPADANAVAPPRGAIAPVQDKPFDYGKIFNEGSELATDAKATKSARTPVDNANRAIASGAPGQWPRFSNNDDASPGTAPSGKQAAAEHRPNNLSPTHEKFPDFPTDSQFVDAPWPEGEDVLEGELVDVDLAEEAFRSGPEPAQPSFAEQIGAPGATGGGSEGAQTQGNKPPSSWEMTAHKGAGAAQGKVKIPVDVPVKPPAKTPINTPVQAVNTRERAPDDWLSQRAADHAGFHRPSESGLSTNQGAKMADNPFADDTYADDANTENPNNPAGDLMAGADTMAAFDDDGGNSGAEDDPFMQLIEERLATLEAEQRDKVEAVRGAKRDDAEGDDGIGDAASSQAMAPNRTLDAGPNAESELAMLSPARADTGTPLNADVMPEPPAEYRPGPGMPLPTDRLDKTKSTSPFAQTQELTPEEAEAAARDLILQAELIYKEDGARKLLGDLKRLSEHTDVSRRLKAELADHYARFSKLYNLYTAGQKDFALARKEDAFEHWIAFLNAEKIVIQTGTSFYAAEVRNIVAQEYMARATQAERQQDWPQAWRYWNAAKNFGKTAVTSRKIREIEQRAQRLFDQGIDLEATDPVAARNLWRQVMQMLPAQHALRGQASAKVSWYDQWRY